MIYQRMVMGLKSAFSAVQAEQESDRDADRLIRNEEEHGGDSHHHEHHAGRDQGFAARRPRHLAGFGANLREEPERTLGHRLRCHFSPGHKVRAAASKYANSPVNTQIRANLLAARTSSVKEGEADARALVGKGCRGSPSPGRRQVAFPIAEKRKGQDRKRLATGSGICHVRPGKSHPAAGGWQGKIRD